MKKLDILLHFSAALLLFTVSFFTVARAEATPSDASPSNASYDMESAVYLAIEELMEEIDYDDLDEYEKLELLNLYISSLSGPGIASASNASISNIEQYLADIRSVVVPLSEDTEADVLEVSEDGSSDISVLALSDLFSLDRNVIIYEGIWNGVSARLVIPASNASALFIDADDRLYNVGTANIVGRIFYDDFEPLDYEANVFTLTPCLGNNASTLYNYTYPSYNRRYYESNSRLTYTDTYGLFIVQKVVKTPSDLPESVNGIYLLVLILIGGVMVLCLWKKSPNS